MYRTSIIFQAVVEKDDQIDVLKKKLEKVGRTYVYGMIICSLPHLLT